MSRKDSFSGTMPGGRQQFPGIRWWPTLGIYGGVQDGRSDPFFSETTLMPTLYDKFILNSTNDTTKETNYLNLADPSRRVYFSGSRKYRWRDMLIDESVAPTSRIQARDPAWSNYKWNTIDPITEAMNSSVVAAGKAKVSIFVATTATAERNPLPAWVMTPSNNTIYHYEGTGVPIFWRDPDLDPDLGIGKDHLRLDKQGACDAMTDWLIALVRRYGADERIANIIQGEYYPNDDFPEWLPAGFDNNAYRTNMRFIWREVIRYAPRDKNNNRVSLIQGQPITSGNYFDEFMIEHEGLGSSGSGIGQSLFNQSGPTTSLRKFIYGKVPSQHQVNPGNLGDTMVWPSTPVPNPFGLTAGQSFTLQYQHMAWFCSSGGPTPMDSLYMRDQTSLMSQWHTAYTRFGPNGTDVATWGQIPNYPPLYS